MKTDVWALVGIVVTTISDTTSDSLIHVLLNIDFELYLSRDLDVKRVAFYKVQRKCPLEATRAMEGSSGSLLSAAFPKTLSTPRG